MRLIDADALHEVIVWHRPSVLRQDLESRGIKTGIDAALEACDAAPTVRCEGCAKKKVNCSIREMATRLYGGFPDDFGCAFFERREP